MKTKKQTNITSSLQTLKDYRRNYLKFILASYKLELQNLSIPSPNKKQTNNLYLKNIHQENLTHPCVKNKTKSREGRTHKYF